MNGLPKYVASTTLEEPLEWDNSTLIGSDVVEEMPRLKQEPGGDIPVLASADLVQALGGRMVGGRRLRALLLALVATRG